MKKNGSTPTGEKPKKHKKNRIPQSPVAKRELILSLTARIFTLEMRLKNNPKAFRDAEGKRHLGRLVRKRLSTLSALQKQDESAYTAVLQEIRKERK